MPRVLPGFFHLLNDKGKSLYGKKQIGLPGSTIPFWYALLTTDVLKPPNGLAKFKFGEPDKNGVRQLFVYLPQEEDRG